MTRIYMKNNKIFDQRILVIICYLVFASFCFAECKTKTSVLEQGCARRNRLVPCGIFFLVRWFQQE
jgi:hypothetical protein